MEEELHDMSNDSESDTKSSEGDPLECGESVKRSARRSHKSSDSEDCPANDFINDIVTTVSERMKNPFGLPEFAIESVKEKRLYPDTPSERRRRRNRETKEAQEFRLLKQRMLQMKVRLLTVLEAPEKAEEEKKRLTEASRRRRQRIREGETPEEAAARKQRHADRMRSSRKRLLALETPEQTAARIAKRNETTKRRMQERQAKETPEERAARLERKRVYMNKLNEKNKILNARLPAKTGIIRPPKVPRTEETTEPKDLVVKTEKDMEEDKTWGC